MKENEEEQKKFSLLHFHCGFRCCNGGESMKEKLWKSIFLGFAVLILLICTTALFRYTFAKTYVWQLTTLGDYIHPVARKTCPVPRPSSDTSSSRRKIGMVIVHSDRDRNWNPHLLNRVIENRKKYCDKYGIDLINAKDQIDLSRPPAWSKLKAMDHYLHRYDYLIYVDMDVVIMNHDHNINDYIDLDQEKDFIMTEDWSGINTGVWIAKNSKFAHWFLQTAWNQTQLVHELSPYGTRYPFRFEQRSFHYLLQTDLWKDRHLEVYPGNSCELRSHFLLLPQCAMNSYIIYPYYWNANREESHYVEGDFLVHFPGRTREHKEQLMSHFLALSS